MKLNVLHKTDGCKTVKNHLSEPDSFKSLCGRIQVENTGGCIELVDRKIYSDNGVEISKNELNKYYCDYCIARALYGIKETAKKEKEEK